MMAPPTLYHEAAYQTVVLPEVLTDGTRIYVAHHPEIRAVRAHGATPEEAIASLTEAFALYATDIAKERLMMPTPQEAPPFKRVIWRILTLTPVG